MNFQNSLVDFACPVFSCHVKRNLVWMRDWELWFIVIFFSTFTSNIISSEFVRIYRTFHYLVCVLCFQYCICRLYFGVLGMSIRLQHFRYWANSSGFAASCQTPKCQGDLFHIKLDLKLDIKLDMSLTLITTPTLMTQQVEM